MTRPAPESRPSTPHAHARPARQSGSLLFDVGVVVGVLGILVLLVSSLALAFGEDLRDVAPGVLCGATALAGAHLLLLGAIFRHFVPRPKAPRRRS